jgi:hypothetical protein
VLDVPADHHRHRLGVAARAGGERRDVTAVAKHRAVVGERRDLVHAVRDVDDREALVAQPVQQREHALDVGGRQRRGRLVEDQDLRLARQRLGDLDHLPAREREARDRRQRVDALRAGPRQRGFGDPTLRAAIDQAAPARRVGDADVVGDAEVGHQRQLLEDARDAGSDRFLRVQEAALAAFEHDAALVGLHHAGHDLDQGRLAGAVLAEQGVDVPGRAGEARTLERVNSAVALGDLLQAQDRFQARTVVSCSSRPST